MQRLIVILIAAVFLCSCSNEFYCKHCVTTTVIKDSSHTEVKDSLAKRDTTIFIPGEVIWIHDSMPCPDIKIEKKGKQGSFKIEIKDSVLTGECIIDTAQVSISWLEHHKKEIIQKFHNEFKAVVVKVKEERTWWTWLRYPQSWACLSIIFIFIVRFILKLFKLRLRVTPYPPFISIGP